MKKIFLALAAFISLGTSGHAATFGLFTYIDNGTSITITDYPTSATGAINIPSTIINKPVTSIGNKAFSLCRNLTSITIPSSVTSIGESAFSECSGLTSITIPSSVTSIGIYAFNYCSKLTSITIPFGVTSIGKATFWGCSELTSITIPSSVTSIGEWAFHACSGLTSITIPSSVTSIEEYAFYACSGLTSITIPSSVTSIGGVAFSNCSGLRSITIPSSVTSIADGVFSECSGLTNITIPSSVTNIGISAFSNCSGLTSITIPSSVTSIGEWAFGGCISLTAIVVDALNAAYSSANGILFNKTQTTLIQYPGGKVGSIIIPSSVTSIGNFAFARHSGLTSITIPSSVTSIGLGAFNDCSGLTSIAIPSSVTSIGDSAFSYCSGLTSITIPSSVTRIGDSAFYWCRSLTKATFLGNAPTSVSPSIFDITASGFKIYYHNGKTGFTSPSWNGYPTVCIQNPPTSAKLVVTGPTSIPWGDEAYYTATYSYPGNPDEDVTNQCEWSVSGGPAVTSSYDIPKMQWNMLDPKVVSTVPLQVSAKITRNNSRIASNALAVTVTQGTRMSIGIGYTNPPFYLEKSGRNFVWRFGADTYGDATNLAGVTYVWYLDNVQIATGPEINQTYTGSPGTKNLKVIATDPQGRTGECVRPYVFSAPPVENEPALAPVIDPILADLNDENGQPFAFDLQKTPNGLVIVTHGLRGSSSDLWLKSMAMSIKGRLEKEGKLLPNIIVLGWHDLATPSEYLNLDKNFLVDIGLIRPYGLNLGFELADWLRKQINRGNVSPSAPVHLIGHSAGGFVVGECGYRLGETFDNIRVSLLDTPYPDSKHLGAFPGSGRKLDRYVSSTWGMLDTPLGSIIPAIGSYNYVSLGFFPGSERFAPTVESHSYAHVWYRTSISTGIIGEQGFGWSPFLASGSITVGSMLKATSHASEGMVPAPMQTSPETLSPVQSDTELTGFMSFGIVSTVSGGYLLTEGDQANSGLVLKDYIIPVGAQSINFEYQFTGAGDGDFLLISHGDTVIGFGSDNGTSQSNEITMSLPIEHLAGTQGDLIFRVVSRGNQNAMVNLTGITITSVDDADMDTLTNSQEVALGTNPLLADSDGDGINDATELNTTNTNPMMADSDGDGASDGSEVASGTDPLDGSSKFAVSSSLKIDDDFTVTWSSVTGKQYRIVRSTEPSFVTYDVVRSGIAATPPQQSFTDSGGAFESRMFYRVELEP